MGRPTTATLMNWIGKDERGWRVHSIGTARPIFPLSTKVPNLAFRFRLGIHFTLAMVVRSAMTRTIGQASRSVVIPLYHAEETSSGEDCFVLDGKLWLKWDEKGFRF